MEAWADTLWTILLVWSVFLNTLSLAFVLVSREALWIAIVWIAQFVSLFIIFEIFGILHLIELSQIALWTPLTVYLWSRVPYFSWKSLSGKYLALALATNTLLLGRAYWTVYTWVMA